MSFKDTITVYWSSGSYVPTLESWRLFYSTPQSLNTLLRENKTDSNNIFKCPSFNSFIKNIFVFKATIDDKHFLPKQYLLDTHTLDPKTTPEIIPSLGGKLDLIKLRKSSLKNYSNLSYNMSWIFFSEEPLLATFTAPYCPPITPSLNAILAPGKFDIGQWYRPFNLDYHIPINNEIFEIKKNDPLFYIAFDTNKKIEFKQYFYTETLQKIAIELTKSPFTIKPFLSLKERYLMAKNSNLKNAVISEIKRNLID